MIIALLLALQVSVIPGPATVLLWDHPGNATSFEVCIDALPCKDVGLPLAKGEVPVTAGDLVYTTPFPALTPGKHSIRIVAKKGTASAETVTAIDVVILIAPREIRTKG